MDRSRRVSGLEADPYLRLAESRRRPQLASVAGLRFAEAFELAEVRRSVKRLRIYYTAAS